MNRRELVVAVAATPVVLYVGQISASPNPVRIYRIRIPEITATDVVAITPGNGYMDVSVFNYGDYGSV